jgi:hypothetical protein
MYFRDDRKENPNSKVFENTGRNPFLPRPSMDGIPRSLFNYNGLTLAIEQNSAVLGPKRAVPVLLSLELRRVAGIFANTLGQPVYYTRVRSYILLPNRKQA